MRRFDEEKKGILGTLIVGILGLFIGYLSQALAPFKGFKDLMGTFGKGGLIRTLFTETIPARIKSLNAEGSILNKSLGIFRKLMSGVNKMFLRITDIGRQISVIFMVMVGKFKSFYAEGTYLNKLFTSIGNLATKISGAFLTV